MADPSPQRKRKRSSACAQDSLRAQPRSCHRGNRTDENENSTRTRFGPHPATVCYRRGSGRRPSYLRYRPSSTLRLDQEVNCEAKKVETGGGQGPHLHEQDFGRTIRGTQGRSGEPTTITSPAVPTFFFGSA